MKLIWYPKKKKEANYDTIHVLMPKCLPTLTLCIVLSLTYCSSVNGWLFPNVAAVC